MKEEQALDLVMPVISRDRERLGLFLESHSKFWHVSGTLYLFVRDEDLQEFAPLANSRVRVLRKRRGLSQEFRRVGSEGIVRRGVEFRGATEFCKHSCPGNPAQAERCGGYFLMPFLAVQIQGGWGNRFLQVAAALEFCRMRGWEPRLYWETKPTEVEKLVFPHPILADWAAWQITEEEWARLSAKVPRGQWNAGTPGNSAICNDTWPSFDRLGILPPTAFAHLAQVTRLPVRTALRVDSCIGVHIRRGDASPSRHWPVALYAEALWGESSVFGCSDSTDALEHLAVLVPDLLHTSLRGDRLSREGLEDALEDFRLLSSTKRIVGSAGSSFGYAAALFGSKSFSQVGFLKKGGIKK